MFIIPDDKEYVVIDFAKHDKHIDDFFLTGLEADSKGNLFAANYYDGTIYKIDPMWICRKHTRVRKKDLDDLMYTKIVWNPNDFNKISQPTNLERFWLVNAWEWSRIES